MALVLKPALENLDRALVRLEKSIDKCLAKKTQKSKKQQPMLLDFDGEDETGDEVDYMLAQKLDSTIARLETLLGEEKSVG